MNLPRWRDLAEVDKAAAVLFLHVRSHEGGAAYRTSPVRYRQHPTLLALSPTLQCNHAVTLYPHFRALPERERERLLALAAEPSQEGTS